MLEEECPGEGKSTHFTFAECRSPLLGTVSFAHESPPARAKISSTGVCYGMARPTCSMVCINEGFRMTVLSSIHQSTLSCRESSCRECLAAVEPKARTLEQVTLLAPMY